MKPTDSPPMGRRAFDRVLIIMFENMYRSYVMQQPYLRHLASLGLDLANFHGVMHPSQTNYIASIAGELCNVSDDDRPPPLPQQTIVDLVEAAGLEWKAYMDGYAPEANPWKPDLVPDDQFPYLVKHNPFASYRNILESSQRWARVVSQHQLFTDAAGGTLPHYAWFTPDMWNDGHYLAGTHIDPAQRAPVLVDQQAVWLEYFFGMLKFPGPSSLLPEGTLVVVTFDESDFQGSYDPRGQAKDVYDGPNQIYTVLLGSMIEPGVETEAYNHYSLLRTIEVNFGLGSLGKNDTHSNWFQFLWGRRFAWGEPEEQPWTAAGPIGLACHRGAPLLIFEDAHHRLVAARVDGAGAEPAVIGAAGPFAVASAGGVLHLVVGSDQGITERTNDGSGWSEPAPITPGGPVGAIALAAFDEGRRLMLCWSDGDGAISSLVHDGRAWASQPVGLGAGEGQPFRTRGAVCLAVLGSCIFCIYEAVDSDAMMVVTYNTADFNVLEIVRTTSDSSPFNDTTRDAWSPSAFPVERFASAASPVSPGEPEPKTIDYAGRGPLAAAVLDGVVHLAHPTPGSLQVVTETMSISGLLTPRLPISYRAGKETTTSNGYGTLAQAGWSGQAPVRGAVLRAQPPGLAMCADPARVYLAHVSPSGAVAVQVGRYTGGAADDD